MPVAVAGFKLYSYEEDPLGPPVPRLYQCFQSLYLVHQQRYIITDLSREKAVFCPSAYLTYASQISLTVTAITIEIKIGRINLAPRLKTIFEPTRAPRIWPTPMVRPA